MKALAQHSSTSAASSEAAVTPGSAPVTAALLYLRPEQAIQILPISRRCLSNWQRKRQIKFYRVNRTILFRRSDIEAALEKFAVNTIGEPKPRKITAGTDTITSAEPPPNRKRRAGRISEQAAVEQKAT